MTDNSDNLFTPSMLKSVEDQIAEQLIRAVVTGKLNPGDRLVASDLALQFGVCRSTIVSVMQLLAAFGVVQTKRGPKGGSYIKESPLDEAFRTRFSDSYPPDNEIIAKSITIDEFCRFRVLLETEVCLMCARDYAKDHDSAYIKLLGQNVEDGLAGRLSDKYNVCFHTILARGCSNKLISRDLEALDKVLQSVLEEGGSSEDSVRRGRCQHKIIYDAIISGDEEAIRQAVIDHVALFRDNPAAENMFAAR